MTTPILEIPEIAAQQTAQYVIANEAFRALSGAANNFSQIDFAADDVELNAEIFQRNFLLIAINNTVARVLELPGKIRFFAVLNQGSETLTIMQGTTELTLAASASAFYFTDGTENGLIKIG